MAGSYNCEVEIKERVIKKCQVEAPLIKHSFAMSKTFSAANSDRCLKISLPEIYLLLQNLWL